MQIYEPVGDGDCSPNNPSCLGFQSSMILSETQVWDYCYFYLQMKTHRLIRKAGYLATWYTVVKAWWLRTQIPVSYNEMKSSFHCTTACLPGTESLQKIIVSLIRPQFISQGPVCFKDATSLFILQELCQMACI